MKSLILLIAVFCFGLTTCTESAHAKPVQYHLSYGQEARPEKDAEGHFEIHTLTNLAFGMGFENYLILVERAYFQEASGNNTLRVTRDLEDYLLWAHWRAEEWYRMVPYVGLGLGAYKERVTTELAAANSTTRESDYKFLSGGNFGFQIALPIVWISLEGRLLFGDELDQQPTLGALMRFGIWF